MSDQERRYIASCSFGKDSLATVILAKTHGDPLDEVVYCRVMFDETTSAETPEHERFIQEVAIPRLVDLGIKVTIIQAKEKNFVQLFHHRVESGPREGQIWAWPLCGRCYVQRDLKVRPIERWKRTLSGETVQYIGIASDESERLLRLDGVTHISLLNKYGIGKDQTAQICREHGLLSPAYEFTGRGGCFFCPNARQRELRHLYDNHKELWEKLLQLQSEPNKTTELFTRRTRIDEIDQIFKLEDRQLSLFEYAEQPQCVASDKTTEERNDAP